MLGLHTDVSKLADIEALADAAEERVGKIHLVHNNAGVEGYLDGPIWAATAKDWDWTLSVNLMSVIYGIRTFVPRMLAHGEEGHVVNTCSMTSVIAAGNMYGICKHAILAMTEVLAADLQAAGANVAATGICPGIIATNLFHGSRNRQAELSNDGGMSASGSELRDHMHSVLSKGMPPSEVGGAQRSAACSRSVRRRGTPGSSRRDPAITSATSRTRCRRSSKAAASPSFALSSATVSAAPITRTRRFRTSASRDAGRCSRLG